VKWSSISLRGESLIATARKLCLAATIYNLWMHRNYLKKQFFPPLDGTLRRGSLLNFLRPDVCSVAEFGAVVCSGVLGWFGL
jgi:hypothetical protein